MMQQTVMPWAKPWWNNITEVPDWACRAQRLIEELHVDGMVNDRQALHVTELEGKVWYLDDLKSELVANFPHDYSKRRALDHSQLYATFEFFRIIHELQGTFATQCKRRRLSKAPPQEEAPSGSAQDAPSAPAQSSSAPRVPPGAPHSFGDPDSPGVEAVPDSHDFCESQDWDMGPETGHGDTLQ